MTTTELYCVWCRVFGHDADTCESKVTIREVTDDEHAAIQTLPNLLSVSHVRARSMRAFDVEFVGKERNVVFPEDEPINFSAWFPLAVIREMSDWPTLAPLSDHPDMVAEGDWSGIRDSSKESIWSMFDLVFKPVNS